MRIGAHAVALGETFALSRGRRRIGASRAKHLAREFVRADVLDREIIRR